MGLVRDPLKDALSLIPKSALIVIVGNPYTLSFHVGLELLRRLFMNYKWFIIVNDLVNRYRDVIRSYGIVKNDIELINDLSKGVEVLSDVIKKDNHLAYVVLNDATLSVSKYRRALINRPYNVSSVAIVQVDENMHRAFTYIADIIIRLNVVEDLSSLRTLLRTAKISYVKEVLKEEVVLSYRVTPSEVLFEELTRI